MAVKLHIQVITSGAVSAVYEYDSDKLQAVKIGRLSSANLRLEDSTVSRIHAAIEFRGSDPVLVDMGSGIGTSVNGKTISQHILCHGDVVLFGNTKLIVGIGAPAQLPVFGQSQDEESDDSGFSPRKIFDYGEGSKVVEVTRVTQRQLEVEHKVRLTTEQPITDETRSLEMRLYWGQVLLRMEHYIRPKAITIGEDKRTDIFLSSDGLPARRFPLIRCKKGDYILTFTNHMEGELEIDGQLYPLQSLKSSRLATLDEEMGNCYQVKLPSTSRCLVHWGGLSFALRFVPTFKPFSTPLLKTLDYNFVNTVLLSFFFHLAVVVALLIYPIQAEKINQDLLSGEPDRFVSLILSPPKKSRVSNAILDRLRKNRSIASNRKKPKAKKMEVDSLTSQAKAKTKPTAQKRLEVRKRYSKLFTDESGATGGILGNRGGAGSLAGSLSRVIGTTGKSSNATALAGLGLRREALVGGGAGKSVSSSRIGTIGRLGSENLGEEYGKARQIGERQERRVISLSTPTIMGALSKEVVQKVINRNKNQIRYCYEVELQRNQNLTGRVAMRWVILGTGRVGEVTVRDSTMGNTRVERCMMNRIRTWQFPAPAGGGIVEVNYPFVFKAN